MPITIPQVMSGCALAGGVRGIHVLKLLKALSPILEPNLVEMWDTVIPKLVQYLEGNKNSLLDSNCTLGYSKPNATLISTHILAKTAV